jgi:hypothetical protein
MANSRPLADDVCKPSNPLSGFTIRDTNIEGCSLACARKYFPTICQKNYFGFVLYFAFDNAMIANMGNVIIATRPPLTDGQKADGEPYPKGVLRHTASCRIQNPFPR